MRNLELLIQCTPTSLFKHDIVTLLQKAGKILSRRLVTDLDPAEAARWGVHLEPDAAARFGVRYAASM